MNGGSSTITWLADRSVVVSVLTGRFSLEATLHVPHCPGIGVSPDAVCAAQGHPVRMATATPHISAAALEAARTRPLVTLDGNEAAARIAFRTNEVIAIYPITPSSTMGEL